MRYPPLVKITKIISSESEAETKIVKEGTQLKLICQAEGNPEQFRYKWSVDDHNVNGRSEQNIMYTHCYIIF